MRNDVAMTTNSVFQTLQHDPSIQLPQTPEGASGVRLSLAQGLTRELTMVKIGRFFVFGLLEDRRSWCLIRLSSVLALTIQTQNKDPASSVNWTRRAAGELLTSVGLPARATVGFRESPQTKVDLIVLGANRSLIKTDSHLMPLIPLQAISYLEIAPN